MLSQYGPYSGQAPPDGGAGNACVPAYRPQTSSGPEPAGTEGVIFLIALKGGAVYLTPAYWVEGDALHYLTVEGHHNQVSLELVDRQLSVKLNEQRHTEFGLPAPR